MQSTKRRLTGAAVVSAVLAGAVSAVVLWPTPDRATPYVAALPQPAPHSVAESPVAGKARAALARVPAAAPRTFRLSGAAFTIDASVCGMPYVRPLNPPGDQLRTVCWVQSDFGAAPGSPSTGTTYLLGHAWGAQRLVLNPLSEFATAHAATRARRVKGGVSVFDVPALTGYRVRLGTATGRLAYHVTTAFLVAKADAGRVHSVMAETTRNRVVIITCAVKDGVDLDQNVIVYATLDGAHRT